MFMHCLPSMILLCNHLSRSNLEALLSLYTIIRYNYLQLIHMDQCWNASVNSSWRLAVHGGNREHRRHALLPLLPAFPLDSVTHIHPSIMLPAFNFCLTYRCVANDMSLFSRTLELAYQHERANKKFSPLNN